MNVITFFSDQCPDHRLDKSQQDVEMFMGVGRNIGWAIACGLSTWLLAGQLGLARDLSLDGLYAQVLRQPGDSELNLRFARMAEASGKLRWALAAYERVTLNDPGSREAQDGLTRVRRKMQPEITLVTAQIGAQYESNPRYYLPPRRGEAQAIGALTLLDERNLASMRWRTTGSASGIVHARESDLTYGVASLQTGPVLDAFAGWSLHPFVAGSVSYFDHHFYYGEGSAGALMETNLGGIYRAIQVRGAYRSYDSFFASQNGFYVDARGKFAVPNVFGSGVAALLTPWLIWSDIDGAVTTPTLTELQPGAYLEYGGKLELLRTLAPWLVVGGNIAVSARDYRKDIVAGTADKRRDVIVSPGAALIFPNIIAAQTDLRIDYRFVDDRSNDAVKSFTDHIVTASIITRFDPTLRFWNAAGR
jgi:hypothetical protein